VVVFAYAIYQKDISVNLGWNTPVGVQSMGVAQSIDSDLSDYPVVEKKALPIKRTAAEERRLLKQKDYIKMYEDIARREMELYGIPASITLAQGLLESNAGDSKLATNNKNHFGMKCFSKTCRKGHCSNFSDDSHKDFFRIYKSSEESYRAHSKLLSAGRYRHLLSYGKTDYEAWANGLQKAGYATDPSYSKKIIQLINELELYYFDQN
jgi:flagellum-specific peptidoglycan hydrolase FlgJ